MSDRTPARDPRAGPAASRPNVTGDIEDLLTTAPSFRNHWRGYDRLQVDNYVTWVEAELVAGRREADHLLSRYGAASAELELARRVLAQAPKGRDLTAVSDRLAEILRLAGDEAAAIVDAAGQEAGQILAGARREADARVRNAQQVEEAAVAASGQLREQATAERAEASSALDDARAQAENLLRDAQAEHARITGELVEARAQWAAVQAETDALRTERDEVRELLCLLTDRIGQALATVTGGTEERFVVVGHRAQALPS